MSNSNIGSTRIAGWLRLAVVAATTLVLGTTLAAQKTFPTPEDAVVAAVDAVEANNLDELMVIFGPEGKKVLSSGDPVDDQMNREVFLVAYRESAWLEPAGANTRLIYIGNEDWPFPIPITRAGRSWKFDTAAGVQEVLFRRIGRNELSTIRACHAYLAAQREYAKKSHDGKPTGLFAQKIASEDGKQDGLYWKVGPLEEPSPLGDLVAEATEEGYRRQQGKATPFHGYFFRILTAQGKSAKGGANSYIVNGEMSGGFALLAFPAEHGNSGVMTFIVNQDGVVYEKNLGPETAKVAAEMTEYARDRTWSRAE